MYDICWSHGCTGRGWGSDSMLADFKFVREKYRMKNNKMEN